MSATTQSQHPETFQFKCPNCKAKADMPWPQAANGYTGFCPVCGQPFVIQPPWVSKEDFQRAQYESRQRAAVPSSGGSIGPAKEQSSGTSYAPSGNYTSTVGIPPVDAIAVASKVKRNEVILNIIWIVLGVIQCIAIYTIVAGIWNIINGIIGLRSARNIVAGNPHVVTWYAKRKPWLIALAVVNLVLGAFVGLILVGLEWMLMDYVARNSVVFEKPQPAAPVPPADVP